MSLDLAFVFALLAFAAVSVAISVWALATSPQAHDTLPRCPLCGGRIYSWTRHLTSRVPGSGWFWRRFWR